MTEEENAGTHEEGKEEKEEVDEDHKDTLDKTEDKE